MSYLWTLIENQKWKMLTKSYLFLFILTTLSGVLGFMLWGVLQLWVFKGFSWMVCFIGYAETIAWVTALFYIFNHNFHSHIPYNKM